MSGIALWFPASGSFLLHESEPRQLAGSEIPKHPTSNRLGDFSLQRACVYSICVWLTLCTVLFLNAETISPTVVGPVSNKHFIQYSGQTGQGRITFYISKPEAGDTRFPLVVWIQGTGCESHFVRDRGEIFGGLALVVRDAVGDRAAVMAVEKPGVEYLKSAPPDLEHCPAEFLRRYTLDSWAETIAGAINMAQTLPGIDTSRVLLIGHSEGGIVALRVSNLAPNVTHAASLSGSGPNSLFHIAEFTRQSGEDPEREIYSCWRRIQADPESVTNFCWGGTFRQWTSFMRTSAIEEALRSNATLYFVHGSADKQATIAGFDVLRAELEAHGRAATFERIEGADHGLNVPGQQSPDGLASVFSRIISWFLADSTIKNSRSYENGGIPEHPAVIKLGSNFLFR